jgi:hypothetical protein
MASPLCTAYGGTPTINGVNVPNGDTVDVALADHAGVRTWTLQVIGTSAGVSVYDLSVNAVAKTATFTSPDPSGTVILKSTINGGYGPDGQLDPSLSCTFGIYVLSSGTTRLLAVNETTEGNAAYGWTASINAGLALAGNAVQYGGDIGGTLVTPRLVAINAHYFTTNADVVRGDGSMGAVPSAALPLAAAGARGGVSLPSTPTGLFLRDDGGWGPQGLATVAIANADTTLSAGQAACGILVFTGALTAYRYVTLPLTAGRAWWVINTCSGAFGLNFRGPTGGYCTINNAARGMIVTDGTAFFA